MTITLTWLSHASWFIQLDQHRVLLDPFFADNPAAHVTAEDFTDVSHVLVSHGHFDHVADVEAVARAAKATIVTNFEISAWYGEKGFGEGDLPAPIGMNLGGRIELPFGEVQLVPALHSSGLPDGRYGGTAGGFILRAGGKTVYFACDTAFFSDMRFYAGGADVAVLPIGDLFTMGVRDSVQATRLIEPKVVLPTHYDTWPPIQQDAEDWAKRVQAETSAKPVVLPVGGQFTID